MTFRSPITIPDKLYSCLLYAMPMAGAVIPYGIPIFAQIPFAVYPFVPFILLRGILDRPVIPQILSIDTVVFLCVYFFVVRNLRIAHFVRFNAMQAILLRIILFLIEIVGSLLAPALGSLNSIQFLGEVFFNTIFMGMTAACVYAIVQSVRGVYAEMPIVSEAAYYQVPY